ncbi:hypothetical protein ABTX81_04970 [Kitasatospora sp. NPDC097605]|uniref:hypothetical protein n=1 Tax=Kitasatospora sp. NPDC097605 TaxID=3157226 RepID=UPI00332976DD
MADSTAVLLPSVEISFARYEEVTAALADPALVPPPAESGPVGGMAWLRATVARFSAGEHHAARRAFVEADLAGLDPDALRQAAAAGFEADVRVRAVRVLAQALGLAEPEAVARAVGVVARSYFTERPEDPEADAAVAWLLPRMLPERDDTARAADTAWAANRIGLLVQACDATATLVEHARAADAGTADPVAAALRHDPPVRTMRRRAVRPTAVGGVPVPAGADVLLDIAAAQAGRPDLPPLTFGAPPRPCPGRTHALALAAGILHGASALPPAAEQDGSVPDADVPSAGIPDADVPSTGIPDPDVPDTDDRDPVGLVPAMVEHVLALAQTWTGWDGRPVATDGRTYTPHKAIRRVADHLLDHLAEVEARLAGEPTQPDHWHASATTTPADLAPFTPADLDEARSRLTRLARIWAARLAALTPDQLDRSPGRGWSFRQIAFHVAESAYYADAVGDLRPHERTTAR